MGLESGHCPPMPIEGHPPGDSLNFKVDILNPIYDCQTPTAVSARSNREIRPSDQHLHWGRYSTAQ